MLQKGIIAIASSLALISCSVENKKDAETIAVSIAPLEYFVDELSGGDIEAAVLVPSDEAPETFEPAPSTLRAVAQSDAYLSIGNLSCEVSINNAVSDSVKKVRLAMTANKIEGSHNCSHHHGEHNHSHHHGSAVDPHIWMSVNEARIIADEVTKLIIGIKGEDQGKYQAANELFDKRLDSLDIYIKDKLEGRKLDSFVIYHPALAYFSRDYGLTQIPIEFEGKEPTVASLKGVIDFVTENNIKYILHQSQHSRVATDIIAEQCGCQVVEVDPLSPNWYESMKNIADQLSLALKTNE